MDEPRNIKIREALRQAERMLAIQQEARESTLRRAAELMRLAIVTLGAVLVVAGLVATTNVQVGLWLGLFLLIGAAGVSLSVVQLAVPIAGLSRYGLVAYGPDLRRLLDAAQNHAVDEPTYHESLVRSADACLAENHASLALIQAAKGRALWLYIVGAALLLGGGVYIAGGAIHV